MADDKKVGGRSPEGVTLEIEDVSNANRHLFNKLCEEKRITEGKTPSQVFGLMLWQEAYRVFGVKRTKQIHNDFWKGNEP